MSSRDYLAEFNGQCQLVAAAARAQANVTASTKGFRGRPQLEWYDDFTDLLVQVAARGGIKPTISTNRQMGKKGGNFVELAYALEGLLVKHMRSQSKTACIKRLERSLRRNQQRQKPAKP